MQVTYKRDMNRNYMVIGTEGETDYQLKMLCSNKIKGFLPVHTNLFNGNLDLYYDISSRQPISRLYEKKELQAEDLKAILFSLQAILHEARKYLLDCNNILFTPEYCYCNPENRKMEWVFLPTRRSNSGYAQLAEFFIDRVNHCDKEAVDLAYRFFKGMKKENFVLEELLNSTNVDVKEEIVEERIPEEKNGIMEDVEYGIREKEEFVPLNLFQRIKQTLLRKTEKMDFHNGVKTQYCEVKRSGIGFRNEMEFEERKNYSGETIVMGMEPKSEQRRLRGLEKQSGEYISLKELPCILGKMQDCADVVLQDKSVSRMHARIFQKENELYLEDLNSTNGTFINGLPLESNEIMRIKIGDEIGFGNLRYIYE